MKGKSIGPMDWLICVVLGHDYEYKCSADHGALQNYRRCKTCNRKQCGKYIHSDYNMTWSNCDDQQEK